MRAFHATPTANIPSILEQGILRKWEGVYLTDSLDSALRWMGFRMQAMGHSTISVVEVEVNEEDLEEGTDHSPLMQTLFGAGRSLLSPESIGPERIIEVHHYSIGEVQEN